MLMNYLLFLMVFLIQLLVKLNEKLLYQMGKYIQLQLCHISFNLEMRCLMRISKGDETCPVGTDSRWAKRSRSCRDQDQILFLIGTGTSSGPKLFFERGPNTFLIETGTGTNTFGWQDVRQQDIRQQRKSVDVLAKLQGVCWRK